MRKVRSILTVWLFVMLASCESKPWTAQLNPGPTLDVPGLEGVALPQTEALLQGVTGFSSKLHSLETDQDFIVGFNQDDLPIIFGFYDDKQKSWNWKEIGLRDLADQVGLEIGVALGGGDLFNQPQFYEILNKDFDMATIHYPVYWDGFEIIQGSLNFSNIDWYIDRLKETRVNPDILIRGHPLVWYESNPKWLKDGNFNRDELLSLMNAHITNIVEKYRGIIQEWVVVNEPFRNSDALGIDFFNTIIGPDYIKLAFQTARAADPSAILIFNDVENETSTGTNTQQTKEIIDQLKQERLVDGVGLQMHIDGANPPRRQDVVETMLNYGIPVYITELDVDLSSVSGSQEARFDQQAIIYGELLEACLVTGVCKSFTMWGMGDKYSWLERDLRRYDSDPTLYDDDLKPKAAYFTVLKILSQAVGAEPKYRFP